MAEPLRILAAQQPSITAVPPDLTLVSGAVNDVRAPHTLATDLDENPIVFVAYMGVAFAALAAVVPCIHWLSHLGP